MKKLLVPFGLVFLLGLITFVSAQSIEETSTSRPDEILVSVGEEFTLLEDQVAIAENYDNNGKTLEIKYLDFDNNRFYFEFNTINLSSPSGIVSGLRTAEPIEMNVGDTKKHGLLITVVGHNLENDGAHLLLEPIENMETSDIFVSINDQFFLIEDKTAIVENYDGAGTDFRVKYLDFDNNLFYFNVSVIDSLDSLSYSIAELDVGDSFEFSGLSLSVLGNFDDDKAHLVLETITPVNDFEEVSYTCHGCKLNNKCYPLGYIKTGQYCSDNYEFVEQLTGEENCENNFECKSNLCIDEQCIEPGLFQKIINWLKRLFI